MDPVRYRILGTTQAIRPDGTAVPVGGARLRALLTVLALRTGRTVPVRVLVDEVWGADPPADATGALQALVGRLRRALGADAVASAEGGYRLTAAADDIDLHRFERLTGEGLAALADGDAAKAAVVLDDALALWHDPALSDLPDRTAEAARWETRHLDARRARLTAALALGRPEQTLPELTALCDTHPLDEPLQALRLRALRDAGRTAQALAAYEDVRRLLADRLGSDPGPELRTLHAQLLTGGGTPPGPRRPGDGGGVGRAAGGGPGVADGRADGHGAHADRHTSPPASGPTGQDSDSRPGAGDFAASRPGTADSPAARPGAGPAAQGPGSRPGAAGSSGIRPGAAHLPAAGPGADGPSVLGSGAVGSPATGPGAGTPPAFGAGASDPSGPGPDTPGASTSRPDAEDSSDFGPGAQGAPVSWPGADDPSVFDTDTPGASASRPHTEDSSAFGTGAEDSSGFWPSTSDGSAPRPATEDSSVSGPTAAAASASSRPGTADSPRVGPGARGASASPAGAEAPSAFGRRTPHAPATWRPGTGDAAAPQAGWAQPSAAPPVPAGEEAARPGTRDASAARPGAAEPAVVRPGAAAPRPPSNLRARLTSFVGREADLAAIRADLGSARLVTLLGPGGAGKTRLSQEAAETVRPDRPDGIWLAELAPVDDPAAVPEAVLTAVGARETVLYGAGAEEIRVAVADRHDDPVERLVEHCGRRRMLLLLDNCEHVVDAAARLVAELLARCPQLTVLATSREPLGVPGELLRPVEPLPEPVALRLFADRGAAVRPGFRVDADEDTAAASAEICRRLDGLPLAIELAAARLRLLTPRQIADRLDDRFRLLTSGSRTVLPRQQTLRAVVDWSWDLLDATERDVLCRLSVFAGGCDLAAAEAVCGPDAFDALGSLVDKSLVVAAPDGEGGMRYRLLETVAEYAAERLDETDGRTRAERAHLTYYRELARTTDPLLRGPGQRAAIARFELEYENLRTALRHAVAARDEQECLCLILSLVYYWQMREVRVEARTWCREVMAFVPDPFTEPPRPVPPVWERCTDAPPPMTGELLVEARRGLHLAHLACMDTEMEAWQSPEAKHKLRVISEAYEPGLPQTCRGPGMLWFFAVIMTGDSERIHEIVNATVATCRTAPGFDWELGNALQLRANLLANRADWAGDATRDADEALDIFRRLGDDWGTAEALSARGEAHERAGRYEQAADDYEAAVGHARRLGAHAQVTMLRSRLGAALLEDGERERGEAMLREVIADGSGPANEARPFARLCLVGWLGATDRVPEAREQLRTLREEFGSSHFVIFEAFILGAESWLAAVDGRDEEALTTIRHALDRADDPVSRAIAPHLRASYVTIGAMAVAGVDGGSRARDAARCLGAADAMLPSGHVPTVLERHAREQVRTRILSHLGEGAFEEAYAQGEGLSMEEALALLER
ncbi:winged helix-turn-helix domain-containing protein [Streptomyces seoulensis]|nr:winged helix-turn-helix domain-containing protein [Streptomyces seoulensis]